MNCGEWEERIALYVGGDLAGPAAAEAARHLGECAGCQVFASGLRATLETLREGHREEIPQAHYAAVRARVLAELRPRIRWGWVWGVAAAIGVVAAVGVERQLRVPELPAVALRTPGAPAAGYAVPVVAVARPARVHKAAPARPSQPGEELVVKIETADPDVVIYWITETKGDY
jgi:hypothetical protein